MRQIADRRDIEYLVAMFYRRARQDRLLGPVFNATIPEPEWPRHIEKISDFWETNLFGVQKYKGNPMLKHLELSENHPLASDHFERWLFLWEDTVNANFFGETASNAIRNARQIAELMKFKIHQKLNP